MSEKLRTLTSSNYHKVQYFLLKLRTRFLLTNVYKSGFGNFFYFVYILSYLQNKKDLVSTHSFLYIFINNLRSKQNKKNPEQPFVHIVTYETFANLQQKILNLVTVGAGQSFQSFRQIAWFHGNNRVLP